jgi:subtilisin-like proprotein convertase family protein
MKFRGLIFALMLAAGVVSAQTINYVYSFSVNQVVPDNSESGIAFSTNLSGMSGSISNVAVTLDIAGGYNGDLYAYLLGPGGDYAVLLNRVGMSSSNADGYADAGFNVTLNDNVGANNIHNYQSVSYVISGGQLTGVWAADGRTIDPESLPALFDGAAASAGLFSFNGANPNDTWTLFLADLSTGGQSTVVSWGLDVTTVPEPGSTTLLGLGALAFLFAVRRRLGPGIYRLKLIKIRKPRL